MKAALCIGTLLSSATLYMMGSLHPVTLGFSFGVCFACAALFIVDMLKPSAAMDDGP